jgi:hypothetical protein
LQGAAASKPKKGLAMYFVAGLLVVLSGLFYGASQHQLGSIGKTMCTYGDVFFEHPAYVLVGAGIAALWGTFVSIR